MSPQTVTTDRASQPTTNWVALAILSLGILTGCNDEAVGAGEEEGDGTGCLPEDNVDAPCECVTIHESLAWKCQCYYDGQGWADPAICEDPVLGGSDYLCAADYEDAYTECANTCGDLAVMGAIDNRISPMAPIPCTSNPASITCGGWNPATEITYNTGADRYEMDWSFIAGLVADPEPLWACDDSFFDTGGGYFVVADADSGEMLYELGLRDGDKIVSLNDISISDYNDVALLFGELWGETSFTLEVLRGANTIELDYVLSPLL